MEAILPWIIKLVGGALGGGLIGGVLKKVSLGGIGNIVGGMVGGGILPKILAMLGVAGGTAAASSGGLDLGGVMEGLGMGAAGGGGAVGIVGAIKAMLGGKKAE